MTVVSAESAAQRSPADPPLRRPPVGDWLGVAGGVVLIWLLWSATAVPGVNEAHYFAKARQFWNPQWLPRDLFLVSGYAHWLFYAVCGWPTRWVSLETTVWIVRLVGWCGLALGWSRLFLALRCPPRQTLAAACLFAVFSSEWNFSGEWVVGGAEAKVLAYAAVLCGLAAAIESRWRAAWLWLGLATAWHPLVGGWAFLVVLAVRALGTATGSWSVAELCGLGCGAAIGFLGGVLPALGLDQGVDPVTRHLAHAIYVRERLGHHLVVWDFPVWHALRFAAVILIWREMARRREPRPGFTFVNRFAWGALAVAALGIVGSSPLFAESTANAWLRFYWYRLADFAIPLAAAVAVVERLPGWSSARGPAFSSEASPSAGRLHAAAAGVAVLVAAGWVLWRAGEHLCDPVAGSDRQGLPVYADDPDRTAATRRNWQRVCAWVRANTPPTALCATPRYQQTFRWLAERAEYANWKDVPQDAASLVVWATRLDALYGPHWAGSSPFGTDPQQLAALVAADGIDYLLAEQRDYTEYAAAGWLPGWELVYPADPQQQTTYVVLRAPPQPVRPPAVPAPDRGGGGP